MNADTRPSPTDISVLTLEELEDLLESRRAELGHPPGPSTYFACQFDDDEPS